jgi:hypothetical protein
MGKTLTIRIDKAQDDALTRRAKALGKTRSEVVRELIDRGLRSKLLDSGSSSERHPGDAGTEGRAAPRIKQRNCDEELPNRYRAFRRISQPK